MTSYPRLLLSYVLAGLFCLGVWYLNPVPQTPPVPVHAISTVDIKTGLGLELKQKEIERVAIQSARLYKFYGCSSELAYPTAQYAVMYNAPVKLATAMVIVESSCNPYAISKAGAVGLTQVMPKLYHVSRKSYFDRDANLKIGIRILAELIHRYGVEEGTAYYFGVTPGSDAGWDYAYRVMRVAGYK
jgi:soluble lytic murein transglycosylase-like protein